MFARPDEPCDVAHSSSQAQVGREAMNKRQCNLAVEQFKQAFDAGSNTPSGSSNACFPFVNHFHAHILACGSSRPHPRLPTGILTRRATSIWVATRSASSK